MQLLRATALSLKEICTSVARKHEKREITRGKVESANKGGIPDIGHTSFASRRALLSHRFIFLEEGHHFRMAFFFGPV